MEKLYTVSKNKTGSWLWLRSWTRYCQIQTETEEKKNTRVSRRKEIIKVREEINEKETKETTANINKAKSWFFEKINKIRSDQIRSVTQSCPTLCDPMNHSTPGLPVHHQLPELTQTHLILCCPLLLLPPIPPSIRVFSNEGLLTFKD